MTNDEIQNSPRVRAAMAKERRDREIARVAAATKGTKRGETTHLRNAAREIDRALEIYDVMASPPALALDLAAVFDSIIVRIDALVDATST